MTAENYQQTPNPLFPIPTFTTTHGDDQSKTLLSSSYEIPDNTRCKKRRLSMDEQVVRYDSLSPPEKSPRRNDPITESAEEEKKLLIDISKMSRVEILVAYKRIWEKLDMSKPSDAKLEPFVWRKIREYQKNQ